MADPSHDSQTFMGLKRERDPSQNTPENTSNPHLKDHESEPKPAWKDTEKRPKFPPATLRPAEKKEYACPVCKVKFDNKSNVNRHVRISHKAKTDKCQYCFNRYKWIDVHLKTCKIKPLKLYVPPDKRPATEEEQMDYERTFTAYYPLLELVYRYSGRKTVNTLRMIEHIWGKILNVYYTEIDRIWNTEYPVETPKKDLVELEFMHRLRFKDRQLFDKIVKQEKDEKKQLEEKAKYQYLSRIKKKKKYVRYLLDRYKEYILAQYGALNNSDSDLDSDQNSAENSEEKSYDNVTEATEEYLSEDLKDSLNRLEDSLREEGILSPTPKEYRELELEKTLNKTQIESLKYEDKIRKMQEEAKITNYFKPRTVTALETYFTNVFHESNCIGLSLCPCCHLFRAKLKVHILCKKSCKGIRRNFVTQSCREQQIKYLCSWVAYFNDLDSDIILKRFLKKYPMNNVKKPYPLANFASIMVKIKEVAKQFKIEMYSVHPIQMGIFNSREERHRYHTVKIKALINEINASLKEAAEMGKETVVQRAMAEVESTKSWDKINLESRSNVPMNASVANLKIPDEFNLTPVKKEQKPLEIDLEHCLLSDLSPSKSASEIPYEKIEKNYDQYALMKLEQHQNDAEILKKNPDPNFVPPVSKSQFFNLQNLPGTENRFDIENLYRLKYKSSDLKKDLSGYCVEFSLSDIAFIPGIQKLYKKHEIFDKNNLFNQHLAEEIEAEKEKKESPLWNFIQSDKEITEDDAEYLYLLLKDRYKDYFSPASSQFMEDYVAEKANVREFNERVKKLEEERKKNENPLIESMDEEGDILYQHQNTSGFGPFKAFGELREFAEKCKQDKIKNAKWSRMRHENYILKKQIRTGKYEQAHVDKYLGNCFDLFLHERGIEFDNEMQKLYLESFPSKKLAEVLMPKIVRYSRNIEALDYLEKKLQAFRDLDALIYRNPDNYKAAYEKEYKEMDTLKRKIKIFQTKYLKSNVYKLPIFTMKLAFGLQDFDVAKVKADLFGLPPPPEEPEIKQGINLEKP